MVRNAYPFLVACLALAGCTSFSGAPQPVISVQQARAMIDLYPPDKVVQNIEAMTVPADRTSYRNRVVASYLMATDAYYDQFRRDLAKNVKGGNIGFDLATLGLTGLASQWKNAAGELATIATVTGGTRATLNKELYFEKTLPTLLSLMESRRLTVRSEILKGLSQPESAYTIQDAFSDLWRYQSAASIDGAIQQAAAAAADEAKDAKLDYSKAVELCTVDDEIDAGRRKIIDALQAEANAAAAATDAQVARGHRQRIQLAMAAAGKPEAAVPTDVTTTDAQLDAIADYVLTICSSQGVTDFTGKVRNAGVKIDG